MDETNKSEPYFLGGDYHSWSPIPPTGDSRDAVASYLRSLLLSPNLSLLLGLGPSTVAKGPTMGQLWEAVEAAVGAETMTTVQEIVRDTGKEKNLERLLSRCERALDFLEEKPRDQIQEFVTAARTKIVASCTATDGKPEHHITLLGKIRRRPERLRRPQIFTTNYDLCIENAASHAGVFLLDGFLPTIPPRFDGAAFDFDFVRRKPSEKAPEFLTNVARIFKLHGSIDWRRKGSEIERGSGSGEPLLIFPNDGKFEASFQHPFLEMMTRFQTSLREADTTLIVIGVGFNDDHIARPIEAAIRSNPGLQVLVVDINLRGSVNPFMTDLRALAEQGHRGIALFHGGFQDFVALLPDLGWPSEEERIRELIRAVVDKGRRDDAPAESV
jgi:SIR2-like domain